MKHLFVTLVLVVASIVPTAHGKSEPLAIDGLFASGSLWELTTVEVQEEWKSKGFKWSSDKLKNRGIIRRDNMRSGPVKLTAFKGKLNVEEVAFLMKNGKLAGVSIAIWNKGDSKNADISEKEFAGVVDAWTGELNGCVASRYEDRGKDTASAARAERRMWIGDSMLAQLEFSGGRERIRDPYSGRGKSGLNFQGEFIRLRLLPRPDSLIALNTSAGGTATVRRGDLAKAVKHEASGDVFIPDIPMVDQGDKGYCAVATAARVFNYYGVPADQHEMAQVAGNSAGGGGTNPDEMEDAMRKLSGKYKTRFQSLVELDYSSRKYKSFLRKYNRAAKKLGKRELDTDNFIYFMGGLDAAVLRAVKGEGTVYDGFMRKVRENIDKGVPLMWALQLGLFSENGQPAKQAGGGHMRLIIGYNDKKEEIIFSDSWGTGHEMKRMSAPDASAATMGLYLLQPSM